MYDKDFDDLYLFISFEDETVKNVSRFPML